MKLYDYIKNENLITCDFKITRAVLNKDNKSINVFLNVDNVLAYNKYIELEKKLKEFFIKMGLSSKINITYTNIDLTGNMEE